MDVGCCYGGLEPQPLYYNSLGLSHTPIIKKPPQRLHRCNNVRVHPYAHPPHIKVLKHFIYIWYGCGMQSWGFWASTMTLQHHSGSAIPQLSKNHPQHLHRRNSVRLNPCAHPQHAKMLKHIVYIQYGFGMQSEASCSLNHDTTTSFRLSHTPIFQNLTSSKDIWRNNLLLYYRLLIRTIQMAQ